MNTEWAKGKLGTLTLLDIGVVLLLTTLVAIALLCKLAQYYSFRISDWDTGIYSNVLWNLVNGNGFYSDVLNRNHLGVHFSPIIVVFAPFFIIYPSPVWLLAAQGLAVGTTYVLLYFVAIKIFRDAKTRFAKPLALVFAIWAFLYRPLTSALLFEFHPSTLATPLLAAAILALLHSCDRGLWLLVAVLLLSKENAPLAVLGLGCYAGLVLFRPRLGMALGTVAAASAALIMGVVMPLFRSDDWVHYSRLGPFAEWQEKSAYLLALVKALAYLPLASWRSLMCAVPLVGLNLSVAFAPQFSTRFHYDDFASVFLLVAAMHGAVVVLRVVDSAFKGWRAIAAYIFMALVALLLMEPVTRSAISSLQRSWFGGMEQHRELAAYRTLMALVLPEPVNGSAISYLQTSWPDDTERQLRRELAPYRSLPFEIGITAQQLLGPYLSARPRYAPLSASQGVDMRRLKPGDKLLITPMGDEFPELERLLETNAGLTRVHGSPVLHVYEVTPNPREVPVTPF
jgi:uncharacterized membrane protein